MKVFGDFEKVFFACFGTRLDTNFKASIAAFKWSYLDLNTNVTPNTSTALNVESANRSKKDKALEKVDQDITFLVKFLVKKSNVHKEIHRSVNKFKWDSSCNRSDVTISTQLSRAEAPHKKAKRMTLASFENSKTDQKEQNAGKNFRARDCQKVSVSTSKGAPI